MEIVEELSLTEADRAAGVTWQGMVKLGDKWQGEAFQDALVWQAGGFGLVLVLYVLVEKKMSSRSYQTG